MRKFSFINKPSDLSLLLLAAIVLGFYLLNHFVSQDNKFNQENNSKDSFYIEIVENDQTPLVFELRNEEEIKDVVSRYKIPNRIKNGDKFVIRNNEVVNSRIDGRKSINLGIPIGVNTANPDDLTSLPGIGEKLAQRIIDYRESHGEFKTINDLDKVDGIGEKKLEAIKPFINLP